jgi:hypothetical protein
MYPPGLRCLSREPTIYLEVAQAKRLEIEHEIQNPLQSLFVERAPICNATVKTPDMDEVETVFLVHPFIAAVVDFKLQVRRNIGWLNRGEVCADDRRGRVKISKLPDCEL